jgi:uncharacterized protein YecE (DUF72 family)
MAIARYHLGCPVWGRRDWIGELFRPGTRTSDHLAEYARVFNAVEGNTTFYAVPPADVVARWRDETPSTFRFCFKLPRTITHDRLLRGARREAEAFVQRMKPLGPRIGPMMVQLPAAFGPRDLPVLEDFLVALPAGPSYAVEVRHPDFHTGSAADELDAVLQALAVDRVVLDTTGLFRAAPDTDEATAEAQRKKPAVPLRATTTAQRPVVRYVGESSPDRNEDLLAGWAERVDAWIEAGLQPYVFAHSPDDRFAPQVCAAFHRLLSLRRSDVGELPRFPALVDRRGEQIKLL